jgi:hypothetical protein
MRFSDFTISKNPDTVGNTVMEFFGMAAREYENYHKKFTENQKNPSFRLLQFIDECICDESDENQAIKNLKVCPETKIVCSIIYGHDTQIFFVDTEGNILYNLDAKKEHTWKFY